MLNNRSPFIVTSVLGIAMALVGDARAGFLDDMVVISSVSTFSGDPTSVIVPVTTAVELPDGFGSKNLADHLSIDIESDSIELNVTTSFGIGYTPFQGLRFSSLNSPGETITGFSVESSLGGVADAFDPSAISFGSDFLNVDLQNTGPGPHQSYSAGDRIKINLQLTPASVPEPASFVLTGLGLGIAVAVRRRTSTRQR